MRTAALNIRLNPQSKKQLDKLARRWGRNPSQAGAQLLEEELRRSIFSHLEFRSTPTGRHAYIAGTRLALWQIVDLLLQNKGSLLKTAKYLRCPKEYVRIAELYARAYPDEIQGMIADKNAVTFESLSRILPNLEKVSV